MKKLLLLAVVCITGLGQANGQGAGSKGQRAAFAIQGVNLITDREVEIVSDRKPADAKEVYDNFIVTVDGQRAGYTYLSYFDFGPYASAPVINIRLEKPLDTGTLRGRTGTARTPGENTQETLGPVAAAKVKVSAGTQSATARWAPFYDYMNIGSKSKLTATGTTACHTAAGNDVHQGVAYSNEHVIDYAAGGIHRMTGRAELITRTQSTTAWPSW